LRARRKKTSFECKFSHSYVVCRCRYVLDSTPKLSSISNSNQKFCEIKSKERSSPWSSLHDGGVVDA
jgi:hypothetical protein